MAKTSSSPVDVTELIELIKNVEGETRNIELKGTMSWDDQSTRLKIVKSILAMTNIRGGGMLIIGITQNGVKLERTGMTIEHINSFDYDKISAHVAPYADPHVRFYIKRIQYESKIFLVISVDEFERVPVVCKKDYVVDGKTQLRRGKFYTRTWRMPETAEVSTSDDLRDIIDLATEKGVARFAELVSKSGLGYIMSNSTVEQAKLFDSQLNALLSEEGELLSKLKLKGYWKVIFRPLEFKRERIGLQECKANLEGSIITLRPYNYPHYYADAHSKPILGSDYAQWSTRISPERFFIQAPPSLWRIYQSGQFVHFFGLLEDYWRSTASHNVVTFTNLVWSLTEIYKFAASLALKGMNQQYSVQVELHNLKERELVELVEPNGSLQHYHHHCTLESLEHYESLSLDQIIGDPLKLALQHVTWILERFDIDPKSEFWMTKMRDKQHELLTRKKYFVS